MKEGSQIGVITPFFCHDGQGNFLFYKRGENSKDEQGKWDCSGGTLLFGEQPEEGMQRKLKSQYSVEPLEFTQLLSRSIILDRDGTKHHWLAVPFIVKVDADKIEIGEPDKMEEIGWFKLDNLPEPLHPGARYVIETYKKDFDKYIKDHEKITF